jgi:hypothetical protein
MAPLSLPEMGIGENEFTYVDETVGERHVRITHEWVERSASAPPAAPQAPISPREGDEFNGTDVRFEWEPAVDSDGDEIADYHFELSSRPDMKWPLSMSFAKLISRTSDAGRARYTLQAPGELSPDREYYWHVRAKDAQGVWGPWSQTWRFTPRGPAPPVNVRLEFDRESNAGVLRWSPNPLGRKPAVYRIYASNEKGFSVSDDPFIVAAGIYDAATKSVSKSPTQFPANFVSETSATELTAIGNSVQLAAANKVYYRVVAVDARGKRSGPSDYAEAPRPIVYSQPTTQAKRGVEYRYQVRATSSLGDLRMRVVDGREVTNYWNAEQPHFHLEKGPSWLVIDEKTGLLSGTPPLAGQFEVVVTVTLERERRSLDPAQLQWGIEKVIDAHLGNVGTSSQRVVIEATP